MGSVWTLAKKDVLLLVRDRFSLFWIFAFPLMFALFFGALFSGDGEGRRGDISLALVDDDGSEASAALVERLAGHESLSVARAGEDQGGPPVVSTPEEARDAVRKGQRAAYVRIPAGWGDSPFGMFSGGGDTPALEVGIDPSRSAEAGFLRGILAKSLFEGMAAGFTDKEAMRAELARGRQELAEADDLGAGQKLVLSTFLAAVDRFFEQADLDLLEGGPAGFGGGEELVEVVDVAREREAGPRSAFEITLPSGMFWGLMSAVMGFAAMIVRERTEGTMLRLRVAPITRAQLLGGKALGCFLSCMGVLAFLLLFGVVALDVRIGSVPLLVLGTVCSGICFTGLMMTSSVLGRTEQAVVGTTWGIMMPFAMIGGGMIPLIAMPPWLKTASHVSPFKWSILALEGAIWRDFTLADMLLPCGILVGTGTLFFVIGVKVFSRLDR